MVKPAYRAGAGLPKFTKHIPVDLKPLLVGRLLTIPTSDMVYSFRVTPSSQCVRFSLQTSNSADLLRRNGEAEAYLIKLFDALRNGNALDLTNAQVASLAGVFYEAWAQGPDTVDLLSTQLVPAEGDSLGFSPVERGADAEDWELEETMLLDIEQRLMDRFEEGGEAYAVATYGAVVDKLLARYDIHQVTEKTRSRIAVALARNFPKAAATGARRGAGDFTPDPVAQSFPPISVVKEQVAKAQGKAVRPSSGLSLTGLVDDWWTEAKAAGKAESTYVSYKGTFSMFSAFLGHDDGLRVTPQDVVAFKDHRLKAINPKTGKPASAKTVKASDLTGLKSVFDWAVGNLKLPSNPATGVSIKLGKQVKVRERDFTRSEIQTILEAANAMAIKARPNQTDMARRWVPWLCAYSGCRVGELVQLRKQDVVQEEETGAWVMMITPEAGTVKGKERRDIPVHPHLIEMGFLDFVEKAPKGYLFMTIKPGSTFRGVWQSKKNRLTEFVRELVKDPNVAPNHGWRHTFKTKGIDADIQEKVLDAICGHAPVTIGRRYGTVSMKAKVDAMRVFPRYVLEGKA